MVWTCSSRTVPDCGARITVRASVSCRAWRCSTSLEQTLAHVVEFGGHLALQLFLQLQRLQLGLDHLGAGRCDACDEVAEFTLVLGDLARQFAHLATFGVALFLQPSRSCNSAA